MRLISWKAAAGSIFFLAALWSMPAWGDSSSDRHTAMPGTLNYVEGQASMGNQALDAKAVGSADLAVGQVLATDNGKAEILLTPGVYLRLGNNSSMRMVSNSLTNTQVQLEQGEAMLEVDQIYPQNNISVSQDGANTRVLKTGLYGFDAVNHQVRVFEGKAEVFAGDRNVAVKGGHDLALDASGKLKARDFNQKEIANHDDLYRWSSLRSQYLSQANVDTARLYMADGWYGPGWWGPGWYWDPWFAGFTFIPGGGFFYNPFGWGFYSPLLVYRAPYVVGHGYHHFDGSRPVAIGRGFHDHSVRSFPGGGGRVGGFRGGAPMQASGGGFHEGGGFHGGGGGFHGGR
jgi:hypothetical protein